MNREPRPIRDILAEAMRLERLGPVRPLWREWQRFADDECEQVRRRADHLIRLLDNVGVRLVRVCDIDHMPTPTSPVIYQYPVVGRPLARLVRKGRADLWEIVTVDNTDGRETVEQAFTLEQAHINGGLVLTADPAAKTVPGIGSQLAALIEIYRVNAAGMDSVS